MQKHHNVQNTPTGSADSELIPVYVNANTIATRYGVTGRYILQLAADGTIPCLRLGKKKCIRFNPEAVSKALENQN